MLDGFTRWAADQRRRDTLVWRLASDNRVLVALGLFVVLTGYWSGLYV